MRTLRRPTLSAAALLLLVAAAPAPAQQLDVVVSGGVSYRVATAENDSTISEHATYHVALESAANFALRTGRLVLILHRSETRVRVVGLPPPGPGPDPDPPTSTDPPTTLPVVFSADFEEAADLEAFFELDGFQRVGGELVATIPAGSEFGGSAKLGLGAVPDEYFSPVGDPSTAYTDVRWCADLRITGAAGVPHKVARVAAFTAADWSEAAVAHVWGEPTSPALTTDPVSTVVGSTVQASGYNDFEAFRWLGSSSTSSDVVDGRTHRICARQRFNSPGASDGLMEVWVDGRSESRVANLPWRGSYDGYGWNGLFLEAYYNGGPPGPVVMAWDNLEVRAAGSSLEAPDPDPDPDPDPPGPDPDPPAGGAWYVQNWSYNSTADMLADPWVGDATQAGSGAVSLLTNAGGPGFDRAMRATFVDAGHGELQVGVDLRFPDASTARPREVWIEYWARWSPNWTVNGPYRTGTCGHKHMFLFDQRETGADGGRWESYVGLFDAEMSQEISGYRQMAWPFPTYQPTHRDLWDGEWELMRYHARMHPTAGRWDMWVNGQLFPWGQGDTDYGAELYFNQLALSRNTNCGVGETMTLDFGPVRVYTTDPGW